MDEDISAKAINGECVRLRIVDSYGKKHVMILNSRKMTDLIRVLADRIYIFQDDTEETSHE